MRIRTILVVSLVALVSMAALPASSQEFEVSQEGNWRIWYTSPDLRAEVEYHWADLHPGDEWLILKFSVSAGTTGVASINRKDVKVKTPDGSIIELPSQAEFRGVRGSMEVAFEQQNIWGPSPSRFRNSYLRIVDWFFSPPGATFHREFIAPGPRQYCSGPLVFQIPGGVQPGEWTLIIDRKKTRDEIPFVLGEND